MIVGLLSWWDEQPAQLHECVTRLYGVCGHVVAVDGAYALWPRAGAKSPAGQAEAILDAARSVGGGLTLYQPPEPWQGNEVGKRSFMFELGRNVAREYADWFLVVDADEFLVEYDAGLEQTLEASSLDVATLTFRTSFADSNFAPSHPARRLFRAIPELRVVGTHWCYVGRSHDRQVMLWANERVHRQEPALDARSLLTLEHRKLIRTTARDAQRGTFDQQRRRIERLPPNLSEPPRMGAQSTLPHRT